MAKQYNFQKIRVLLTKGFTDEGLRHLCFDVPALRPVYDQLATGTGKTEIVQQLLEYAERNELIETLLDQAKEHNSAKYKKYQPYYEEPRILQTPEQKEALQTASPNDFDFTVLTLKEGQMVRDEDLPLTIEGKYHSTNRVRAWVVLQDHYGRYYLQNPPIRFLKNERWRATNIRPGKGIDFVHFVHVDAESHLHFLQIVSRDDWGPFEDLPGGCTILHSIQISRVQDFNPNEAESDFTKQKIAEQHEEIVSAFKFSVETLRDRQIIADKNLPLTIEGQYSSASKVRAWVVLQDQFGHYYLQNPPITFLSNGQWVATNILPGIRIEFVHFVRVSKMGQAHFDQMVAKNEWGAFDELPPDSTILRSIRISRVR